MPDMQCCDTGAAMNTPMHAAPPTDDTICVQHADISTSLPLLLLCAAAQSTKSPGSRSSVVSIGSVCGAAGPAFTTLHAGAPGSPEALQAGKYTPTMKLDFGATRKQQDVSTQSPSLVSHVHTSSRTCRLRALLWFHTAEVCCQ
jgi:hypothetical protein